MKRKIVKSSNLGSVGYDPKKQVLEIRFKDNSIYQFIDIEQETFNALMKAKSKGTYFHDVIRERYFHKKIRGSDAERKK
jgi:hypothetical protein